MSSKLGKVQLVLKYFFKDLKYAFTTNQEKNVWLIAERGDDAQDNGFALFKYLVETNKETKKIKPVYVISKDSNDYDKVMQVIQNNHYGETVEYGSEAHFQSLFKASALISTHAYGYTPDKELYYRMAEAGIYQPRGVNVFLSHGVTDKDCQWLHYEQFQPDLFCTSSPLEYDLVTQVFKQPEEVVLKTGMPRYDALDEASKKKPKKQILIMPTWRQWLQNCSSSELRNSVFFQQWAKVLKSKQLTNVAKSKGYTIVFYLHPELAKYRSVFKDALRDNPDIQIQTTEIQNLMMDSDILVTDYSSVYIDMLRMGRKVIFFQFDKKRYETEHYSGNIIDPKLCGRVADSDTISMAIYEAMEGCRFGNQEFLNELFFHRDNKQCERVVNVIFKAQKGKEVKNPRLAK